MKDQSDILPRGIFQPHWDFKSRLTSIAVTFICPPPPTHLLSITTSSSSSSSSSRRCELFPSESFLLETAACHPSWPKCTRSRIKVVHSLARLRAKGDNIAPRVLRRPALWPRRRRSPRASLPAWRQRRLPKPERRVPFLQIVIKRE